jgi:hypothetical protein
VYADDHHPPHFHVTGPDFQIIVRIFDGKVIAGQASRTQIAEAMAWAKANKDTLMLKWRELNERN